MPSQTSPIAPRRRLRRMKKVGFQKADIGIPVQMVSPKIWGASIMQGKARRIETIGKESYLITVEVRGELKLEDLIT